MSGVSGAWSWRHAVARSGLPSTTRHLLLTLSLCMDETGGSCFPSIADLVDMTGLAKNTVLKHVESAVKAGWLARSQHGYRGQKWKRAEYVARWPGRDLDGAAVDEGGILDDEEGGAAIAPPSGDEKVVQHASEGGATAGSKVVQQVHQDKDQSIHQSNTSPVEREARGRASDPVLDGSDAADAVSRETWLRRLKRAHSAWPSFVSDSAPTAEKAWFALAAEERIAAAERAADYVEAAKGGGRKTICSFGVYLAEKRWEKLPEKAAEEAPAEPAAPFGKLWGALRFSLLFAGPIAALPKPTSFVQKLIDQGGASGEAEKRAHLARHGWPAVNRLHGLAAGRRGEIVPQRLAALADLFQPVRVGGEIWMAWERLHEQRGWPWLSGDLPERVWMPAPEGGGDGDADAAVAAAMTRFAAALTEIDAADDEGKTDDAGKVRRAV